MQIPCHAGNVSMLPEFYRVSCLELLLFLLGRIRGEKKEQQDMKGCVITNWNREVGIVVVIPAIFWAGIQCL